MQARLEKTVVWLASVIVLSVALSVFWTVVLASRSGTVVLSDCHSGSCLRVQEGSLDYLVLPFERRYEVWITRNPASDYGYSVSHSFASRDLDTLATIRNSKVEWSDEGVTLIEPSGQRLYVPRRLYEGGR